MYEGNKLVYEKHGEDQFFYYYDSYGHFSAIRHICAADNTDYIYYANTKPHVEIVDDIAYRYTYDEVGNIIRIEKGARVGETDTASGFTNYFRITYQ